jgi:hypothetical protein
MEFLDIESRCLDNGRMPWTGAAERSRLQLQMMAEWRLLVRLGYAGEDAYLLVPGSFL